MYLPYVGKKIERLLKIREEMNFEVYWDGACGADKISTFAPMGVRGLFWELHYFWEGKTIC